VTVTALAPSPDVVVVGGGIVGAATAYELCRRGARVVLVDAHHPGRASDAGAGILSPETTGREDPAWCDLAQAAGAHYGELISELEQRQAGPTGYRRCGLLRVALGTGELPFFDDSIAHIERRAPGVLEELDVAQGRELFPLLGPVLRVAYSRRAARVDGRVLVTALIRAAGALGLETRRCLVTGFRPRRGGATGASGATAASGARAAPDTNGAAEAVSAVCTTTGDLPCGAVVVCSGAWSSALAAELDWPLPVTPLKGQIAHLRIERQGTDAWPIVQPVLGYYLVSWPRGRVACGGTLEADAGWDHQATVGGLYELAREGLKLAPELASASLLEVRVGLRPATPDDLPVVGRLPGWRNAYVAAGHGTEGLLLGPLSGALIARGIVGEPPGIDASSWSPARFGSPPPGAER
jgi:D-amino-acid dehydrogenase